MTPMKPLALAVAMVVFSHPAHADTDLDKVKQQLSSLQKQVEMLQKQLAKAEQKSEKTIERTIEQKEDIAEVKVAKHEHKPQGIKIGGAIRTNYSYTSYDTIGDDNKNRGGDFDFDIFRLNFSGDVGDVKLNAEIRFFDYMTAVKYAYAAYDFADDWQVQAGITKVPFGNWPYNSHNYFFSTNYYVGLEDDHDLGVLFKRKIADNWQLDLGFFKNDELGGINGYVDNRSDRYSYDIVGFREAGDDVYADPGAIDADGNLLGNPIGEYNTFSGRYGYHIEHEGGKTEIGVSALAGGLHDGVDRAGDYNAWALHLNSNMGPWNLQLQHGEYNYDIDNVNRIAVGAYSFYDSMAAEATMSSANIAYSVPVQWGAVTNLQFYNDYSAIYDKSDNSKDTWMNVTGFSVAAGGLFTYFDLVHGKNMPFVGGSLAGDSSETERRFNINIGYYF
ncbi:porin [uncultured Pseudoalteromonas sp.]|uniref:porin n=1 Tax=uncultured Pseudoalteromonas sp. TaxID=114053 RepID=UPI0025930EFF|nr:porin [uncultured Pseudoalteromonas sp.]